MKFLLIASLFLISNFDPGNTIAVVGSNNPTMQGPSCNWTSTQNETTFVLELSNGQLEVTGQTLMGFAYSEAGFSNFTNPLLTGSEQHIYSETGKAFDLINRCYAKSPGYNYAWKGIGDDGALIARAAAEKAKALNFPTSETSFQKTFRIMKQTTFVNIDVNGKIVAVANGNGHDIQFYGMIIKHFATSLEVDSFQGYLYVYLPETGNLINFDGVVQVCTGTESDMVGIGGILKLDVVVPPNQGLVDPAGVERFLVLPKTPPTITAEVILNKATGDQIVVTVGNDTKVLEAAPVVGLGKADSNFKTYIYSESFGQSSDIMASTSEAYFLLSNC